MRKLWIALFIAAILIGLYFVINNERSTSLQELFKDEGITSANITSIEVDKPLTSEETTVTDPNKINKITNNLLHTPLKKNRYNKVKDFSQSYWITIFANGERRLGITYYDSGFVSVFTFQDSKHYNYKIADHSDISTIKGLFK
ncbi:DUF5301 domain-containing protein [Bacillus badius]|uniref:DUF5301 domain-containing protein n=1 Tax=Bacillus badius TaxID=1455 RepID=UPI000596CF50|nr:DUF5301 domain-containing protein [Bacillus badius]MED4718528.1 DUF5301 domain-containing protein [Bacillus badius]